MAANPKDLNELNTVAFSLNGNNITAFEDETILQAARRNGVDTPHLCYKDGLRADGNCRACVVEIEGERVLQPSCVRTPTEGMVVNTTNERVEHSQKMVLELLQSDMADKSYTLNSELDHWSQKLAVGLPRFEARHNPEEDLSHPPLRLTWMRVSSALAVYVLVVKSKIMTSLAILSVVRTQK